MQFNPQAYSEEKRRREKDYGTNCEHRKIIIPIRNYFQNMKRRQVLFATTKVMKPE
jgi:hypothetical protein